MTAADRRSRLVALLPDDVDAVLVTDIVNVRYLTGFSGSNGAVLVPRDGDPVMATDGRYATQVAEQAPDLRCVIERKVDLALLAACGHLGVTRLGIEAHVVTVGALDALRPAADDHGVALLPTSGLVERLRLVKDDDELALLARACAITTASLASLLPEIRPGVTERQLAGRLEWWMREHGADAPAFESIVAGGPHSAVPHHEPTDRPLGVGDLCKIDCGARHAGYHADLTRTVVLGSPAAWQVEVHDVVARAQAAGREALAPGADVVAVDAAARAVIADAGYGEAFGHGLGHGVGLRIHEAPLLSPQGTGILVERVPVTVEPGVYLPGRGGVRIEDTLVVRAGGAETLTTAPRELLVLG